MERDVVLEVRNAELQGLLVAAWMSNAKEDTKKDVLKDVRQSLIEGHTHAIFTADHLKKQVKAMLRGTQQSLHKERTIRMIDTLPTKDAVRYYFDGLSPEEIEGEGTSQEALIAAKASIEEALAMLGEQSG